MTCIVAVTHKGIVTMGCDSAGVDEAYNVTQRTDPKIFKVGDALIGFTTSFRMGQLLGFGLRLPTYHKDTDIMYYLVVDFVDAVRSCLKNGGYTSISNNREEGGSFLVGIFGRVFQIESDFQVGEASCGFDACGCGAPYALGAMRNSEHHSPAERITNALETAAQFSAGVRGPFLIMNTENAENK